MASLSKIDGRYLLRFVGPDKRRRKLYLGDVAKRDAESIKTHVEAIVSSMIVGAPPPLSLPTLSWLLSGP